MKEKEDILKITLQECMKKINNFHKQLNFYTSNLEV